DAWRARPRVRGRGRSEMPAALGWTNSRAHRADLRTVPAVSGFAEFVRRGRRALGLPRRYVAQRLVEEAARTVRRPLEYIQPALLTDRALLRTTGARSI